MTCMTMTHIHMLRYMYSEQLVEPVYNDDDMHDDDTYTYVKIHV